MKIAVCDDEIVATSEMEGILLEIAEKKYINIDIDVFFDGNELTNSVYSGEKFDLIYLDIEMKKKNGIDTAINIREIDTNVSIIFVSGHDIYIRKLFEVNAFRFIDKPIDKTLFERYFMAAYDNKKKRAISFTYKYRREIHNVLTESIVYFESKGRNINIHILDEDIKIFNGKLNTVEHELINSQALFIRIHQSYLVNFMYIRSMTKTFVKLTDDTTLPISDERQKQVRENYCRLLGKNIEELL